MTRPKKSRAIDPEVEEAYITFIQDVLLSQMKGLLQAENLEERYVVVRERIAASTDSQIAALARRAAEYWVKHAPKTLTREGTEKLKSEAFNHAVRD